MTCRDFIGLSCSCCGKPMTFAAIHLDYPINPGQNLLACKVCGGISVPLDGPKLRAARPSEVCNSSRSMDIKAFCEEVTSKLWG